jgi:hypothetical protein
VIAFFMGATWGDSEMVSRERAYERRRFVRSPGAGYSLDHLVGNGEHARRNGEAKRLGGLEIDDQLEFGGLLDRQITRLFALEDTVDIGRGAPVELDIVSAVGCKPTLDRPVALGKNVRQAVPETPPNRPPNI